MSNTRCCAKCKNPYTGCGNHDCPCHGKHETTWEEEWAAYEKQNSPERNNTRFKLDESAGRGDRRRQR